MTKRNTGAKTPKAEPKPAGSEIIRQCVIYAQASAALKAGFSVDTGNFAYAGCGSGELGLKQSRIADKALQRLVGLSPAFMEGRTPLTRGELFAKAGVLSIVLDQEGGRTRSLEADETAFVRFFAREVEDYCRADAKAGEVREKAAEKRKAEAGFLSAAAQTVMESIAKENAS